MKATAVVIVLVQLFTYTDWATILRAAYTTLARLVVSFNGSRTRKIMFIVISGYLNTVRRVHGSGGVMRGLTVSDIYVYEES